MSSEPMSVEELEKMAVIIRCDIIDMICTAAAGHPGTMVLQQPARHRLRHPMASTRN